MTFRRMATFALIASALTSQAAFAAHGKAKPCRNEKEQFIKCEKPKAKPCRNKKGHFAKCGKDAAENKTQAAAPNAPAPVKDSVNPMKSDMPAPVAPAAPAP